MLDSKDFIQGSGDYLQISFNRIGNQYPKNNFVGYMGQTEFRLYIKKCVPSVINNLIHAGYILNMGPEGLGVDKI